MQRTHRRTRDQRTRKNDIRRDVDLAAASPPYIAVRAINLTIAKRDLAASSEILAVSPALFRRP